MIKDRINKVNFNNGKNFFRFKTTARSARINKNSEGFSLEFSGRHSRGRLTQVPIVLLNEFNFLTKIDAEISSLSTDFKSSKPPKTEIVSTEYPWGKLNTLKIGIGNHSYYYYLTPANENFAVRVGPVSTKFDTEDLTIDWENIQWGTSEEDPLNSI